MFFDLHGINFDEAALDYNIFCVSEFGTDRYGNPFPVYFANGIGGQSALYVYIGALLSKVFGFSVTLCRVVKLLAEIVTMVFGGLLIRDIWNKRTEWLFYVLFIISPYFYKMTGMAYDCDMIIPVFVVCMYLANKCRNKNSIAGYLGLGICLGLVSYSYVIGVLIIPLFIVVQMIFGWKRSYVLIETLVAFVVSFPMFWYMLTLVDIAPEIYTDYITIAGVAKARKSDLGFELKNLYNLKHIFLTDTQSDYGGSRSFGTIYQLTWFLLPVGLIRIIKEIKTNENYRYILGFFLAVFVPMLFIKDATTYNFTVIYVFLLLFAAVGLDLIIEHFKTFSVLIGVAYLVMFGFFIKEYLVKEPYIYGDTRLMAALDYVDNDDRIMLDTTGVFQPECYIGIKYRLSPDKITYDEYGLGISVLNITFNDINNYKEYDSILIRNEVSYIYEMNNGCGISDVQASGLSNSLQQEKYNLLIKEGYYIYSKGAKGYER